MKTIISILALLKKYTLLPFALLNNEPTITGKLMVSIVMGFSLSPILMFLKEIFNMAVGDEAFLRLLVLCLIIDLGTGIVKHYMNKSFNFEKLFFGFVKKVGVSLVGMILFNGFASIDAGDLFTQWVVEVGMIANFIYVGGSAFANLYVISGGKFPPVSFMNRLEGFNKNLDIDKLVGKKEDSFEEPLNELEDEESSSK